MHGRTRAIPIFVLALWGWCGCVAAQESDDTGPVLTESEININDSAAIGAIVRVTLANGDVVTGSITDNSGGALLIDNSILGEVRVPFSEIGSVTLPPPRPRDPRRDAPVGEQPTETPDPAETSEEQSAPPEETEPEQSAPSESKPEPVIHWDSEISFGLAGTEGNSETFNIDAAFRTRRQSPTQTFTFDTRFLRNTRDGDKVVERLTLNARNDWKFRESRGTAFARASGELDEFADFDFRLALNGGLGYRWIERQRMKLSTRLGAGAVRDFGSPDNDEFQPELVFAGSYEQLLGERQKVTGSAEYYPQVDDFADFRSVFSAGWEYRLDKERDLTLRLGVRAEYESETVRTEEFDLNYSARIVFGF